MLWFWFIIGFALVILGAFGVAYDDYITIKGYEFDSEVLGTGLMVIGGVLAGVMLLALGINWCCRG
jgi:hypothetical protein